MLQTGLIRTVRKKPPEQGCPLAEFAQWLVDCIGPEVSEIEHKARAKKPRKHREVRVQVDGGPPGVERVLSRRVPECLLQGLVCLVLRQKAQTLFERRTERTVQIMVDQSLPGRRVPFGHRPVGLPERQYAKRLQRRLAQQPQFSSGRGSRAQVEHDPGGKWNATTSQRVGDS